MAKMGGRRARKRSWAAVLALFASVAGCFGPPDLPAELEVVLPADVRETVPVGSGPAVLANSSIAIFRATEDSQPDASPGTLGAYGGPLGGGFLQRLEPDELMFRVHLTDDGRVVRISDNAFYLPELIGPDVIFDGESHGTAVAGLTYATASFGLSIDDAFGGAFPVDVRFLGIPVASVLVYVWGRAEGDPLTGTFGYQAELAPLPALFYGSGGDQYAIYAVRDE